MTRQMPYEPLPASVLLGVAVVVMWARGGFECAETVTRKDECQKCRASGADRISDADRNRQKEADDADDENDEARYSVITPANGVDAIPVGLRSE